MAIGDDFEIQNDRDIRYVGAGPTYTGLAFHNWLRSLRGAASEVGDDAMSIVRRTPSNKAFDKSITLVNGYNIDDYTARYIYDATIIQGTGATEERYDPLTVTAPAGMRLEIIQNEDYISPNYWLGSYNPDSTKGVSHRFLVKVRTLGADIDGRRLIGKTGEFGKLFLEFPINGTEVGANSMAFTTWTDDLNNDSPDATIRGYTDVTNIEGYRLIDVNNDGVTENYYSEWNRASRTINGLYERTKWLSRRADTEDSNADVGSDFQVGNATIVGQGQAFAVGATAAYLSRCFFQLKKTLAPTGTVVAKVYAITGAFGTTSTPTGAALATSEVVNISEITTSYQTFEFLFKTPALLTASTNYFVTLEYSGGDASNYVQVLGLAGTGTHAGNRAQDTGAWAAAATDDLWFDCWTSPQLYGLPGEYFRGITHEVAVDNEAGGPFTEPERLTWASGVAQLLAVVKADTTTIDIDAHTSGTFTRATGSFLTDGFRKGVVFRGSGFVSGGNNALFTVLSVTATVITVTDATGMVTELGAAAERLLGQMLWVQLLSGVAPTDGQTITGVGSGATADTDTVIIERTVPAPFIGTSTGSALIGAYGIGVATAGLSASDKLFDLSITQRLPPNNVTFTQSNLVSGEDAVLVAPAGLRFRYDNEGGTPPFVPGEVLTFGAPVGTAQLAEVLDLGAYGELVIGPTLSGSPPIDNSTISGGTSGALGDVEGTPVNDIDTRQFSLNGALTGGAVTSVVVAEVIPADQPGTGTIRVQRDDGQFTKHAYSARDIPTKTFTIASADFSSNNASDGNNVFTAYIDKTSAAATEQFTTVYAADRTLFVRVATLSGAVIPIKPFESTAVLGSGGGSSNTVRTPD